MLVAGLTDTSLDLEVDALAGSTDARFRVVATDGVNTAFDETPMPIGIPNKAPLVVITEPSDNGVFLPGALVVLKGSATDLEDGSLPDELTLDKRPPGQPGHWSFPSSDYPGVRLAQDHPQRNRQPGHTIL